MTSSDTMLAARLYGPSDMRVEQAPHPGLPGPDEVLLSVTATGICGSDLHPYQTGTIGDTVLGSPLILGHEFAGRVEEIGSGVDWLQPGMRVAVDPSWTCGMCHECLTGNPNLCRRQHFCGLYPQDGSLCEWMRVPAGRCWPVPDSVSDTEAALLEPLGIALHATDLARIRVGSSVAILGAGPIGLCLIQMARLAGANPIYVSEPVPWRMAMAERWGAAPLPPGVEVDSAIEAAWGKETVQRALEVTRPGGTVVLVGIPFEDHAEFRPSVARRKGLTILMSRRMKFVYERGLKLLEAGVVHLDELVTHRFPLSQTVEAFALNAAYNDNVIKVMIENPGKGAAS